MNAQGCGRHGGLSKDTAGLRANKDQREEGKGEGTYANAPLAEMVDAASKDCLGLAERVESVLGRGSVLTLERGQAFLFESDFFLTRFEMECCSTTDFESKSSSSQGAGEWKRILGP